MPKQVKHQGRDSAALDARRAAEEAEKRTRALRENAPRPPSRVANADDPGMELT